MKCHPIEKVFDCLRKYEWLVNFNVTDLLTVDDELRNFILRGISAMDLSDFIENDVKPNAIFSIEEGNNCTEFDKKKYEIDKVIQSILHLLHSENLKLDTVFDVGCGQGKFINRLSKVQSSFSNLVGIDVNEKLIEKATFLYSTQPQDNQKQTVGYSSYESKRPSISFTCDDFTSYFSKYNAIKSFGFVSLHGCGSLFEQILNCFLSTPSCKFMLAIPCCYNLIDTSNNKFICLSRVGQNLESQNPFLFSKNLLMLACQSPDHKSTTVSSLRNIIYRTILSKLLYQSRYNPVKIGKVNMKNVTSFDSYFDHVCKKLSLAKDAFDTSQCDELIQKYSECIEKFWTIRCWLGVVAENFIVLDRIEKLKESQVKFECVEIFERCKSSRNIAFICTRQ